MIPFRSTSTHDLRSTVSGLKVCRRASCTCGRLATPTAQARRRRPAPERSLNSRAVRFEEVPQGVARVPAARFAAVGTEQLRADRNAPHSRRAGDAPLVPLA